MVTIWVLIFVTLVNGAPVTGSRPMLSLHECQALAESICHNELLSVQDARCEEVTVPARNLWAP